MPKKLSDLTNDPVVARMLGPTKSPNNPVRTFIAKTEHELKKVRDAKLNRSEWMYVKREFLPEGKTPQEFFGAPEDAPVAEHEGTIAVWVGEDPPPPNAPAFDVYGETEPKLAKRMDKTLKGKELWPDDQKREEK